MTKTNHFRRDGLFIPVVSVLKVRYNEKIDMIE